MKAQSLFEAVAQLLTSQSDISHTGCKTLPLELYILAHWTHSAEARWAITTAAIKDQRIPHCIFIPLLLDEKSVKDRTEDCKTSVMTG